MHTSLIIPRLNLKNDRGLGNDGSLARSSLLGLVSLAALLQETLVLSLRLGILVTEEIQFVLVLGRLGSSRGGGGGGGFLRGMGVVVVGVVVQGVVSGAETNDRS